MVFNSHCAEAAWGLHRVLLALLRPARLTLLFPFFPDVEWTEWFEHDRVSYTKGGEKISDLRATHPGRICNRPIDIQVTK